MKKIKKSIIMLCLSIMLCSGIFSASSYSIEPPINISLLSDPGHDSIEMP